MPYIGPLTSSEPEYPRVQASTLPGSRGRTTIPCGSYLQRRQPSSSLPLWLRESSSQLAAERPLESPRRIQNHIFLCMRTTYGLICQSQSQVKPRRNLSAASLNAKEEVQRRSGDGRGGTCRLKLGGYLVLGELDILQAWQEGTGLVGDKAGRMAEIVPNLGYG